MSIATTGIAQPVRCLAEHPLATTTVVFFKKKIENIPIAIWDWVHPGWATRCST